ncbi:SURF1 family protein [Lysinibacter cavernae]|uniref:SURF1-like protein n=1 Tax=Lysinibacter cavernae TaxID=1640652 RepID=A0A7X5R1G0_9MICO|nr:SURF1 family protein [Lysinibacter cavernae]NIH53869.1 cytochrome oxidase assembly protein ShyY1 [Lysinibacter cavernae]
MTLTRLESESQIISTPSSDDTQTTRKRTASNLPGAPTIGQVLVRPRWIGALLLAVAVAGGFAWLANWQLESALMNQSIEQQDSEAIVPLESVSQPGSPVGEDAGGRVVTVEGTFAPEDFGVVGNRVNGEENGYWVVGHLITSAAEPANLAVALGWTATEDEAKAAVIDAAAATTAASVPTKIEGRYQPPEGPAVPDTTDNPLVVRSLSPAQQANLWHEVDGNVFNGFLVAHEPLEGTDAIDSVPPLPAQSVNWLNAFYAIEWVVFAGFAFYFWYRLGRDAWEREIDELEQAAADASRSQTEPVD